VELNSAQEYYAEIRALAQEARQRSYEDGQDIQEVVHELVDGHQWVIYTHYGLQVLQYSRHENAYFDTFGPLTADTFCSVMAKLTYAAMEADVQETLSEIEKV
jgi:hypothetical protein